MSFIEQSSLLTVYLATGVFEGGELRVLINVTIVRYALNSSTGHPLPEQRAWQNKRRTYSVCLHHCCLWISSTGYPPCNPRIEPLLVKLKERKNCIFTTSFPGSLSPRPQEREKRDPGRVWSHASWTNENIREGSSNVKYFVALSFVDFKTRLSLARSDRH